MEPSGEEESIVVFHVHQRKDIRKNYKKAYELWRQESNDMNKYRCKIIVKPEELHFKS